MRFAAVVPAPTPAAEFLRRLVGNAVPRQPAAPPAKPQEPPMDLDQRVRLVGEW